MRLRKNGHIINDPDELLSTWADHFKQLSLSRSEDFPDLRRLQDSVANMLQESYGNEDFVFDIPVTIGEVERVLTRCKKKRFPGPDGVTVEHILYGELLKTWILQVFNAIVTLEAVPACFKSAIITPIYKGKGKDSLDPNSYRGISLSPVLSKLMDLVFLERLRPIFDEYGAPHLNQTAYQRGMSCNDATFVVQESIRKYLRNRDSIFQILRKRLTA